MSNALLARQILETVNQLPDEQAREVLDFAAFVARRHRAHPALQHRDRQP